MSLLNNLYPLLVYSSFWSLLYFLLFNETIMLLYFLVVLSLLFYFFSLTEWLPHTKACVREDHRIVLTLPPAPLGLVLQVYQGHQGNSTLVDEETRPTSSLWWAFYTPRTGQMSITFRLKYYDPASQLASARFSRSFSLQFSEADVPVCFYTPFWALTPAF